jgi:diguanylate cyclase (GGDEF)-like protein
MQATTKERRRMPSAVEAEPVVLAAGEPVADLTETEPFRVLIVEDNPDYAQLVGEFLAESWSGELELKYANRVCEARAYLAGSDADCVLLDLLLPDAKGLDSVVAVREADPQVPIVVLSGQEDEALAVEAVQQGAQDYLLKSYADGNLLSRAIRYAAERKRGELQLAHQAMHDSLTGVPNRRLFLDRLAQALARTDREQGSVAVLFLDLDRFKPINDSLGHEAGDQVLAGVAGRLLEILRPSDSVARLGGDEFMMLCEHIDSEHQAVAIAQRALETISAPLPVAGRELSVTASIGIALGRTGQSTASGLIRDADMAMYRAKQTGSRFSLFDAGMQVRALDRLDMEEELHQAVENGEFRLVYQPQVRLQTGELFGVEALLRWEHPVRGLLSPEEFIGVAEETGLIVAIGNWVLDEACAQLKLWRTDLPRSRDLSVSVNVSARQLAEPGFVELVELALQRTEVDPADLRLELTETAVVVDPDAAAATLERLKDLGVGLSVDDFGTGYSSLSLLSRFPVDGLKIDRTFVRDVTSGGRGRRVVAALLGMADEMGLDVVAEGVEDERQPRELRALGCESAQGFLFERPQPAEDITKLLSEGGRLRAPSRLRFASSLRRRVRRT